MIDIVLVADTVLKVHIVIYGCKDILLGDMLWNKLRYGRLDSFLELILIIILFKKLLQSRIINILLDTDLGRIKAYILRKRYGHIRKNLYISFLGLDPHKRNGRILDSLRRLSCKLGTGCEHNFSCRRIGHILRKHLSCYTVP